MTTEKSLTDQPPRTAALRLCRIWHQIDAARKASEDESWVDAMGDVFEAFSQGVMEVADGPSFEAVMDHARRLFEKKGGDHRNWHAFMHDVCMHVSVKEADIVLGPKETGTPAIQVTRLFAVPMMGTQARVWNATHGEAGHALAKLPRELGIFPESSNTMWLGLLPAAKACELALDPLWQHRVTELIQHEGVRPEWVEVIMKDVPGWLQQPDMASEHVAGYVQLGIHTSVLPPTGDVDLDELGDLTDAQAQGWMHAMEDGEHQEPWLAGWPEDIYSAGLIAWAWQLQSTFALHRMGDSEPMSETESKVEALVFHEKDQQQGLMPVTATFGDGHQLTLPTLPLRANWLLEDLAGTLAGMGVEPSVSQEPPVEKNRSRRILH